jgi:hypothetical protein
VEARVGNFSAGPPDPVRSYAPRRRRRRHPCDSAPRP